MRKTLAFAALWLLVWLASGLAQTGQQPMPPNTVWGRIGNGTYGPGSALPFSTFASEIAGLIPPPQGVPVNPVTFGADPTGITDSTSAVNSALAASYGSAIYFPPGRFKIASALTVNLGSNLSLSVQCAGSQNTQLYFPNGGGWTVNYSSDQQSTHWAGCTLTTGQLGGSNGITLINSVSLGSIMPTSFYDMVFMGDDRNNGGPASDYWTDGISLQSVSNVSIDSSTFYGNGAANQGNGINLTGGSNFGIAYSISKSNFFSTNIGVVYGTNIQGVTVTQCNFVNGQVGIDVPAAESGLDQLTVTDSQFNTVLDQIFIQSTVQSLYVANNLFFVPINHSGVDVIAGGSAKIIGNDFGAVSAGNGIGLSFSGIAAGSRQQVIGNFFNGLAAGVTTSGSTPGLYVASNAYNANTQNIIDTGATTDRIYDDPQPAISPPATASPWTYTNGARPSILAMMGGTVSSVTTDGGAIVCTASPCSVHLRPQQAAVVTYSVVPTTITAVYE